MRTDPRSPACRVNDAEWSFASEVLEGPPTPDSSTPGEVLKQVGPFTVEAELGRGGMGQVYQVRYGGRRYALKLVLKDTELVRSRMAREARLVGALQHPGIVRLHGAGVVAGFSFLLYERVVDGRPLDCRELPLPARVERIAQVADAVGFAHEHGIVHRDLKPENVLVDRDGGVRVIDFGLATHASLDRLTQTGAFLGTPSYMAPEQFSMDPTLQTPAVDVWALGVMLFEALTGELPFQAQTALELMAALNVTSAPAPSARNRAVSPALDRVCARALSRRQEDRPPDGVAFARALREALREAPARRVSPAWIVALGGAACAVGAAAVWAWPGRATEPPAPVAEAPDLTDPFLLLRSEGWDGPRLLLEARARLQADPGDVQALGAEAAALQEVDDYAGSVAVAESVLRRVPGDLVALRALAGSLYRLERLDEAYDACERALAVDPRADFALIYGSMIELGRGESARGLELAQRAVALQPQSGEALAARGAAYLASERIPEALQDLGAALDLQDLPNVRLNLAHALARAGRHTEALEQLERSRAALGESRVWQGARLLCLLEVDPAQAEDEARDLLERSPERADLHYFCGEAQRRLGAADEARESYERAQALQPESPWGREAARRLRTLDR